MPQYLVVVHEERVFILVDFARPFKVNDFDSTTRHNQDVAITKVSMAKVVIMEEVQHSCWIDFI